jgi:hypothetical protein
MAEDKIKFTVNRTFAVLTDSLDDALEQTKPKGSSVDCVSVNAGPFQAPQQRPPQQPNRPTAGQPVRMQAGIMPPMPPVPGAGQTPTGAGLPTQRP